VSLYESLDRLLAAGLMACAPALGCALPAGAGDGSAFSRFLRGRGEGEEFGRVLDVLAQEIWLARDRRGFPQEICEGHALALAEVLGTVRPGGEQIAQALEQAVKANGHGPAHSIHQSVAADVMARARAGQLVQRARLVEEVALFLLEQLFFYLLTGPRLLMIVRPALIAYAAGLSVTGRRDVAVPPAGEVEARVSRQPVPVDPAGRQPGSVGQPEWSAAAVAIAARFNLSEGAQRRFLSILSAQNLSVEQRLERFEEMARWLEATLLELSKPTNQRPQVARLKAAAAAALAGGDFEGAFDLLKQVSRTLRECRRQTEARLAEEIDALRQQMAEEAASTANLAELALARFDYDAAAELFAEAAAGVPKSEQTAELGYLLRRAEALSRKGQEKDDRAALAAAAEAYREALRMFPRGARSEVWIRANINLANALGATAAAGADGCARLEAAVEAYGNALEAIDRTEAPLRWALTQLSAGAVLIRLGEIGDRNRHWRAAVAVLVPALEAFEQQGSAVYAEFARLALRQLHDQMEGRPQIGARTV
jgi:tetratricopeptide (TPR) repeat protein